MSNISSPHEIIAPNNPYLQYIANLDIPPKEKIELICIVGSILSYYVDQAFGVQTDQITLGSIRKRHSNAPIDHDMIGNHPETQISNVHSNDVEKESNPLGSSEP